MADLTSVVTGTRDVIGRYFSVVSVIPSALFVVWVFLLVSSDAWSGTPDPAGSAAKLAGIGFAGAAGLVLAALAFGLVLHPLQFAFVQVLEGYWGVTKIAGRVRDLRVRFQRSAMLEMDERATELNDSLMDAKDRMEEATGSEFSRLQEEWLAGNSEVREINRALARYPRDMEEVMPTRLGNVLRRHERMAGRPYGLESISVMPYISRVAAAGDMDYVNDQRSQLDLAVRMAMVAFLASGLTALFMARHGFWLLLALLPYAAGYLSYRGAVGRRRVRACAQCRDRPQPDCTLRPDASASGGRPHGGAGAKRDARPGPGRPR